jgi:hypothetical protein
MKTQNFKKQSSTQDKYVEPSRMLVKEGQYKKGQGSRRRPPGRK